MPATQVLNEMESELGLASEQCPHCGKVNISRILHDDAVYLLRMEPEFQKALREARRVAFGQAIARLQQMSGAAVATLAKMMVEQTAPPSTRVRAAEGGRA